MHNFFNEFCYVLKCSHSVQGGSSDAESLHSVQGDSSDAESLHSVQGGSRDAESL